MDGKKNGFDLNKEQLTAVTYRKGPLLIIAGAGTGKTTVITERIKWLIDQKLALPHEILALTFTEKSAREMEERIDVALPYGLTQMWITTFHAFGDRILRDEAISIGLDPGYRLMTQAESVIFFRRNLFQFDLVYYRPLGNPNKFIEAILQHFNRLKDEDISPNEYFKWAKNYKDSGDGVKNKYLELARAYEKFEQLKVKEGVMDFADLISYSLTLFRSRPNILKEFQNRFKYILIDEFQDTNFAQNELAKLLAGKMKNITVVGDDDQCLPPYARVETSKGKVAIKDMKKGDDVITAVGKGYLSASKVLKVMKNKKKTKFITFETESGNKLEVTDNHKMFCMIPGKKIPDTKITYVYLMQREGFGWRLGITDDLAQRLKLERTADKIIAIKSCTSLEEARYYESVFSMKYDIPTYPFKPRKRMILTGFWLNKLFSEFDTKKNVSRLASDLGIDLNSHHYCLGAVVRGKKERIKIILNMCKRRYRTKWARNRFLIFPKVNHNVSIETSSIRVRDILLKAKIKLEKAKKGWRVRKYFSDLKEADRFTNVLQNLIGGTIEVKFDVGKREGYSRPSLIMPAGNIFPGMYVPVRKGYEVIYERIIRKNEKIKIETVYDLEIEKTHNFIADNIVIHNSIYRFRGAAISNIIQFKKHYKKAKIIVLIQNYRSTKTILDASYDLIQHNNPDRLEVKENINKKLIPVRKIEGHPVEYIYEIRVENEADQVAKKIKKIREDSEKNNGKKYNFNDFAILVRANQHADPFINALGRLGIPFQFLGPGMLFRQAEVKDLIAYIKLLVNQDDSVALFRVLNLSVFELSVRDISALNTFCGRIGVTLYDALEICIADKRGLEDHWSKKINYAPFLPYLSENSLNVLTEISSMIESHLKLAKTDSAGQILYSFLESTGMIKKFIRVESVSQEKEILNISKFFDKLKSYESDHEDASIYAVIDWIEMSMELGESPLAADIDWVNNDAVNILTVHSAKGLEFPVVFLVNLVSDRFPTRKRSERIPLPPDLIKEILPVGDYHSEEERRLFYVGLTRARDRLILTASSYYGQAKRTRKISPFIAETIGEELAFKIIIQEDKGKQLTLLEWKKEQTPPETHPVQPVSYLSYSQINTYLTCPLQYKYRYVLKIPVPESAVASFGSSIHLAMQKFYQLHKEGKKPNSRDLMDLLEKNWIPLGYRNKNYEEKMKKRGKNMLSLYYEKGYEAKTKVEDLEKLFRIKLSNDLRLGGKIDRVDRLPAGKLEIIDYKTGKKPKPKDIEQNLQMTVYAMAANDRGLYQKPPEEVILSFYFLEDSEKISSKRNQEDLITARQNLLKIAKDIETSDHKPKVGPWCDFCDFRLICEAWQ